jgi:O-antigen/teichoic acid export membrane protein
MAQKTLSQGSDVPSPHRPSALRNVISNWGGYISSVLITFFLSPFVVHHLGAPAYGVWVLLVSLTGYLGLLDLGVRGAVTRYIAKFYAQSKHEDASRIASSAMGIFMAAGIIAAACSILMSVFALSHFHIIPEYAGAARIVIPLAGLTVAVSLIGGVFGGVLAGLQRFDLLNTIEVGSSVLKAIVTVYFLRRGYGIIALACIQLSFSLLNALVYFFMRLRLYPQLRLTWGYIGREHLGLIFSFSVYSFLLQVFSSLILYSDAVVIAVFLPVSLVTYFAIAGNLITYARALISGISQIMTPLASSLEAGGNLGAVQKAMLDGARYGTALLMPICVTFMLRGKTFISVWMGAQFGPLAGDVLWVLALSGLFTAAIQVAWGVVMGLNKHRAMVPVSLVEAACNLMLSIILVKKMGIVGVAWGTTLPNMIVCLTFWPWYLRKTLQIPMFEFIATAWLRPGIALVPFALGTYLIDRWWPASNVFYFFFQVALALPLAVLGIWYLCIPSPDRIAHSQRIRFFLGEYLKQT